MNRTAGVLLLTLVASARAQTPAGPDFRVNAFTTGHQRYPSLASDAAGAFVVVWSSDGQDGSAMGVFGRRFAADGSPGGGEFQVNTYTTSNQSFPHVASDAAGNFVVVWESNGQDGSAAGVFGRLFDANGSPVTAEFAVNTFTPGVQAEPRPAFTANGGFVVVWESYFQDGTISGIFGQRFDGAGSRVGPEFQVATYTTGGEYLPTIGSDAAGNFVVAWESDTQEGSSNYGIFGQRFDAEGQRIGGEFHVNSDTFGNQRRPSVAVSPLGWFTVAWSGPDTDSNIRETRWDPTGGLLGPEVTVVTFFDGVQSQASVAADANGNLAFSWTTSGQDGSSSGITARRLDCDGFPQ